MSRYRCARCQEVREEEIPEREYGVRWCDECDAFRRAIPDDDIRAVLAAIEQGDVILTPRESWAEVFSGDVTYDASNGWVVVVFNDCGGWDYMDSVVAPDGRRSELEWSEVLWRYRPSDDVARRCYGVPE